MTKRASFAILALIGCGSGNAHELVPPGVLTNETVEHLVVPMRLVRHVPLVQLQIDNGDPVWFVLDTGAPISVFAKRIESRLTKQRSEEDVHVSGTTPGSFDTAAFVFDGLRLGKLRLDNVQAIVTDLSSLDERVGLQIGGILGFEPFRNYVLTLDYPRSRVLVDVGSLPAPNGRDILPLTIHALHPSVVLSIAGTDTITEVDSGSGFFMEVAGVIAKRLTFRAPPVVAAHAIGISGLSAQSAVKLDGDIRLGVQTLHAPLIFLGEDPSLDTDGVARMGGPLLAHFAVSFDQEGQAIRFARNELDAIEFGPLKSLGLELVKRGKGWRIVDFVPNTPAASLGLHADDVIVSANGKPTDQFDAADWELATYAPVPLHLGILRGTEPIELDLPVALLVP
jgi:Aspartyl protease